MILTCPRPLLCIQQHVRTALEKRAHEERGTLIVSNHKCLTALESALHNAKIGLRHALRIVWRSTLVSPAFLDFSVSSLPRKWTKGLSLSSTSPSHVSMTRASGLAGVVALFTRRCSRCHTPQSPWRPQAHLRRFLRLPNNVLPHLSSPVTTSPV